MNSRVEYSENQDYECIHCGLMIRYTRTPIDDIFYHVATGLGFCGPNRPRASRLGTTTWATPRTPEFLTQDELQDSRMDTVKTGWSWEDVRWSFILMISIVSLVLACGVLVSK